MTHRHRKIINKEHYHFKSRKKRSKSADKAILRRLLQNVSKRNAHASDIQAVIMIRHQGCSVWLATLHWRMPTQFSLWHYDPNDDIY
jgi:hypothetical protein